jgi:DNA-binding NtrC family response regulator
MTAAAFLSSGPGGVLVASPSTVVRDRVIRGLEQQGPVQTASGGAEALAKLESGSWQMLFLDRRLPDLDAGELAGIIAQRYPGTRVVLVDSSTLESDELCATECTELFHNHPPSTKEGALKNAVSGRTNASHEATLPGMVGDSMEMRAVYRMARLVAGRDTTVLITGPTGSGKDLVARAIHHLSDRSGHAFSVLNCAAIPEALVESELFGFTRGAFTGAAQTYAGRISAAQGGTLFLDEIGELPLASQSKLLRFLEHKEIQRLGSADTIRTDVRVVAATNCNLARAVIKGTFREDLFFRLNAFPIRLVPLCQRGKDVLQLASFFTKRLGVKGECMRLDPYAERKLAGHSWPGNVREMQQVLERAAIFAGDGDCIFPEHVTFSADEGD